MDNWRAPMVNENNHRAVLITGTSTGIGRAAALHLDQSGYRVFASVRKEQDGDSLRKEASGRLCPILLDVTDEATILRARDEVTRTVGQDGLWGLVNNAGVSFRTPIEFAPLDEFRKLYDTNVFGLLAVTQAFLPLVRQAHGRVINASSLASQIITPFHGPYTSSKLAVNGITNVMRLELKPLGVQVSLIMYSAVKMPIWERVVRNTAEVASHLPPEFIALYGENQKTAFGYFLASSEKGLTPQAAVQPILHALMAKRARNTYFIGHNALLFNMLDKVIHSRLRE
jgi:NAD(P)-dependent dehydrogenase (short-subunit alcohol dehydrogenase family)